MTGNAENSRKKIGRQPSHRAKRENKCTKKRLKLFGLQ